MIASKIVLLVILLARFLQRLPMPSLILFLTLTLNLKLIMVVCSQVKSQMLNLVNLVPHLLNWGGPLDLLRAFHLVDMGQLLPISWMFMIYLVEKLNSSIICKPILDIYDHVFEWHYSLFYIIIALLFDEYVEMRIEVRIWRQILLFQGRETKQKKSVHEKFVY